MSLIWPLDRPRFRRPNKEGERQRKQNKSRKIGMRASGERRRVGEHRTRLARIQAHVAWTQSKGMKRGGGEDEGGREGGGGGRRRRAVCHLYCREKIIKNRRRVSSPSPLSLLHPLAQIPAGSGGGNTTLSQNICNSERAT